MKWEGISEFVAVAENESFTKASKILGLSIAQVSRQIAALEQRLNVKLFYRTTRKVSLTHEGDVFFKQCKNALESLAEAERSLTNLQQQPHGHIKLTAPVTYGERVIMPLVNSFLKSYPDLEITVNLTNETIDLVQGAYDLAIRVGELGNSSLVARKLTTRKNYICASPEYLEKHGNPKDITDLSQHNCLIGNKEHWKFNKNGKPQSIKVQGKYRSNNGVVLVNAALKGVGIVQLPDYYVDSYLSEKSLIALLEDFMIAEEDVWAVYPYNRQLSPKVRFLVDYLADALGGQCIM